MVFTFGVSILSLMAELSSMASSVAVIIASVIGLRTFKNWRKEKIEQRRIEIAERTLVAAYSLEQLIDAARAPTLSSEEIERADNALVAAYGDVRINDPWDWQMKRYSLIVGERLLQRPNVLEDLRLLLSLGRTYFERDLVLCLELLLQQFLVVRDASETLGRISLDDRAEGDRAMDVALKGMSSNDPLENEVRAQIKLIEEKLVPYLRSDV